MITGVNKKRIIIFLAFLVVIVTLFIFMNLDVTRTQEARATHSTYNVTGWAWANTPQSPVGGDPGTADEQGLGWISLNSRNCDTNNDNTVDAADSAPSGCPSGPLSPYGVHIDPASGLLSGYAWIGSDSDSSPYPAGWVSFGPPSGSTTAEPAEFGNGCPDSDGTCEQGSVSVVVTDPFPRQINGWARVLSMKDLASEGWIHLSGTNYNTSILDAGGSITGWAWGHDSLGWIKYYQATTSVFNVAPTITTEPTPVLDYCANTITFNWDSTNQYKYQIFVDDTSDLSSPIWSSPLNTSDTQSFSDVFPGGIIYGDTYYWGMTTWNSDDAFISSSPTSFTIQDHDSPTLSFTPFSSNPIAVVDFDSAADCYTEGLCNENWTFGPDATPSSSTAQNETVTFATLTNPKTVSLTVTDSDGHACNVTNNNFLIGIVIPGWKEISP